MEKDNENNDFDVIKSIIEGDTELFRVLVNRYKDRSLSLVQTIIKDNDEANDVLQDAFIKAYKNLAKFDFNSSFSTWFYRIVVNTSYTSLKKSNRRRTFWAESIPAENSSKTDSFDVLRENERKEIINQVLGNMKKNDVLILKLFYLGEQSIKEISEITGKGTSNIKVLLHRARTVFYQELEKLIGPEKNNLL